VPLYFQPELSVFVGANGKFAAGVETSVRYDARGRLGMDYDGQVFRAWAGIGATPSYQPPILWASGSVKAYGGAQLGLKLYASAGPYIRLGGFLKLAADTRTTPWWTLKAGLEASMGAQIGVNAGMIRWNKDWKSGNLTLGEWTLAQATTPPSQGAVAGRVLADGGAPLPGVAVSASAGGASATATTGADGSYRMGGLAPGSYTLDFAKAGYAGAQRRASVQAGQTTTLPDVTLAVDVGPTPTPTPTPTGPPPGTTPGTPFPICTAVSVQYRPAIAGNTVVWMDRRNEAVRYGEDIYGLDLTTGEEFPICTAAGTQSSPAVSGNIVVWTDERDSAERGADVYGYDLTTGEEFPICTADGGQGVPSVSGNIVVWSDGRNHAETGVDIWGYDLTTGEEFPICTASGDQNSPSTSGDVVAWTDYRNNAWYTDVYGCDLSTKTEFPICTAVWSQGDPEVSGDIIVWHDNRSGQYGVNDIYGYDMSSDTEFPVCTASRDQWSVAISGDVVVWTDDRHGDGMYSQSDVYGYDLTLKTEFPICTGTWGESYPAVSGNTVVWTDSRDGDNADIWGVWLNR
jgi:beta propeller repeat protein